jgi:hypothetical protein
VTPTDDELLQAVADMYARLDPAPDDLVDAVLARLAMQGLETEYELLTLVERIDVTAGTRAADDAETTETTATVALEFAGSAYRVLVRISTVDDVRRLDGWVVPAIPMRVYLGPGGDELALTRQSADADRDGRFEFPVATTGEVRLWLLPQGVPGEETVPPFVTPPFLV